VTSVGSRREAKALIVATCKRSDAGDGYYAPELAQEQTLENLYAFSARVEAIHAMYFADTDRCDCK
jgi:hypothetical protein